MLDRLLLLCEKYPLDFVTHFSGSLPIFFGIFRYKYLSLAAKLIVFFFVFYFVKETYTTWLAIFKINNYYLQNIEAIVETWILLAIALLIFSSVNWRKFIVLLAVICSIASWLTYHDNSISSVSLSSFRIFAIFICLAYFNKIITDINIKNILIHTLFWFIAGLLVYSAGTLFIVLFSEFWYKDINKVTSEVFDKYWNASQFLFIIFSILSGYGIWVSKCDQENFI